MLQIDDLHFRYNESMTLSSINLQVDKGEFVVVLGPNGVGKTSLLKCINLIHKPFKGVVCVENVNTLKMKTSDIGKHIGYVPQQMSKSRLTVFDAVLLGRKPHVQFRVSHDDLIKVQSALEQLKLEHYSLRYIDELSGGELQKVAIARALVQEPQLLLLDEPTSSLDMKNQLQILQIIRDIVDSHKISALLTMHDINSALKYGDRCCFLKNGQVHTMCKSEHITADVIEDVYELPVQIHHIDGNPFVLPGAVIQ